MSETAESERIIGNYMLNVMDAFHPEVLVEMDAPPLLHIDQRDRAIVKMECRGLSILMDADINPTNPPFNISCIEHDICDRYKIYYIRKDKK